MSFGQKESVITDLSEEDKEKYEELMNAAKREHPNTNQYILDLAIRFYLKHGDDMLKVKSLSEENLQKLKDKHEKDAGEFFGAVEIIRNEDISEEQKLKYETDSMAVQEALKSGELTDKIRGQMKKVAIMEGIE